MEDITSLDAMSIRELSADSTAFQKERAHFLCQITLKQFEHILLVEQESGEAIFLHDATTPVADPSSSAKNPIFSFDEIFRGQLEKHCTDIDPEAIIRSGSLSAVSKALEAKESYTIYYNTCDAGGQVVHKRIIWTRVSEKYLCAMIEDLSEAFQYERERSAQLKKALAEAQANLDANNTFLTLVSRDIRTPLHSIIGLSRIANMELKDISAVESYLHKISMSGSYMEQTINDIRDFIRISWHPIELHTEAIDLTEFMTVAVETFQEQAKERQLHFAFRSGSLKVNRVRTDASALRQVILKLTRNVLNYTLRGGSVELGLSSEVLSGGEVTLALSVTSRGIDLDQDRMQILKEPYEYVMNEVRSNISSIDMDRVSLRAYLHAMKGAVDIDIERGIRTSLTVTLRFPAAEESAESIDLPRKAGQPYVPQFKGLTALLADDDSINLEVSTKLLENTGLTVFTAKNGLEALNLFTAQSGAFDIILMDIRMPVMNGLEAARAIRSLALPTASKVPIIALTVNAFDEDVRQSLAAGMDKHLIKPISAQFLYRVLEEMLGKAKGEEKKEGKEEQKKEDEPEGEKA